MYKKVLAIAIVPMLLVLGGTLAFSAWSGQSTAVFGMSTGTASYTQTITFEGTNANVNPISVSAGSSAATSVTSSTPTFVLAPSQSGTPRTPVTQYVNATNMVSGQYVYFQIVITNTGTVTLSLTNLTLYVLGPSPAKINTGPIVSSGSSYTMPLSTAFLPPFNLSYVQHQASTFNSLQLIGNATSASVPSTLAPGYSLTYDLAMLVGGIMAYGAYTSFAIGVSVPISVSE